MDINHVYIIGGMGSGKTSLANVILGSPILPLDLSNPEQSEIIIHYAPDTNGIKAKCIEGDKDSIISFCTEYDSISKEELQGVYDNPQTNLIELFSNYPFLDGLLEKPAIHIVPTHYETSKSKWIDIINSIDFKESLILFLFRDEVLTNSVTALLSDLQTACKNQHEPLARHCLFIRNRMDDAENDQEVSNIIDAFHTSLDETGVEDAKVYPLSLVCYVNYFEKYKHRRSLESNAAIHTRHYHGGTPLEPNTVVCGIVSSILRQPFMLYSKNNLDNHVTHLIDNKDYLKFKKNPSVVSSALMGTDYEATIKLYSGLSAIEYTLQAIIKNIYML